VQPFEKRGGRFVRARARLVGPRRVRVGETVFTASMGVVLATRSAPARRAIPGLADAGYWTNREAIEATQPPDLLIDLARHNRLAALGWTVLRASPADLLRNPDRFAAQVRAVLRQRAG
jgi:hypothetical protein